MSHFELLRDSFGQWTLVLPEDLRYVGVYAVRAFPVSDAQGGAAIMDDEGHELVWVDQLSQLQSSLREKILQMLNEREFLPEILQLQSVSSFATPSQWTVRTNRGMTQFMLKGEEDIRRLTGTVLLINDAHGVQYMIRDLAAMDRHSRKLLDRFL